jgi:hypothetical protein
VFYLNGQIKGQDLMYRKGVNRFCPNTDKWVQYLLSRGEDTEGQRVNRGGQDARIHLNIERLAGQDLGFKNASVDEGKSIADLWKEAMAAFTITEPQHLFADMVVDLGMQKQAAELAERYPEWAEIVEIGGLLKHANMPNTALPSIPSPPAGVWDEQAPMAREEARLNPRLAREEEIQDATNFGRHEWNELASKKPKPAPGFDGEAAQTLGGKVNLKNVAGAGFKNPNIFSEWLHDKNQPRKIDWSTPLGADAGPPKGNSLPKPTMLTPGVMGPVSALEGQFKGASLTLHREPAEGWDEQQLEAFYKQGFSLVDTREEKDLASAFVRSGMETSMSTVSAPGVQTVTDSDGKKHKALWAPVMNGHEYPGSPGDGGRDPDYLLVLLDGPEKGCAIRYSGYGSKGMTPVFDEGTVVEGKVGNPTVEEPKGEKPKAGGTYTIWFPALQSVYGTPFVVRDVKTSGELTKINFEYGEDKLVVRRDIEVSGRQDFAGDNGMPRVLGADAIFVPVETSKEYRDGPQTPANLRWANLTPPANFKPLTADRLGASMLKTKSASVELLTDKRGFTDVVLNGQTKCRDLGLIELTCKLARDLHLSAADATELVHRTRNEPVVEFGVISPAQRQKLADAYYGTEHE